MRPDLVNLLDLRQLLKPLATINLSKSPTFLGNFCKDVKIYHFLLKSSLGNLYRHLAIFSSHTDRHLSRQLNRLLFGPACVSRLLIYFTDCPAKKWCHVPSHKHKRHWTENIAQQCPILLSLFKHKHNSRVVLTSKLFIFTSIESYDHKAFIRLTLEKCYPPVLCWCL